MTAEQIFEKNAKRIMKRFDSTDFEKEFPTLKRVIIESINEAHKVGVYQERSRKTIKK